MTYTADTFIKGVGRGEPQAIAEWAIQRGAMRPNDTLDYLLALYDFAHRVGINGDVAVAQWLVETSDRVTGEKPAVSVPWTYGLNPAGIGVESDKDWRIYDFKTGMEAAAVHIAHLGLYCGAEVPEGMQALDPRWKNAIRAGYQGIAPTVRALSNRWAIDKYYGDKIAERLNQLEAAGLLSEPRQEVSVALKPYRFVGLDRDVWLPDSIEVKIDIVPESMIGWVRSGVKSINQKFTTFHDTGTPGSTANTQRNYLHNGPKNEDGSRRQVGFNFAVDDTRIIQLTPLNEVTWAAGTPDGNATSWHVEQCFGPNINWERSLRNAMALHGGLCAAKLWNPDTALVPHRHWYGKFCPGQILTRGIWPAVEQGVGEAAAVARAAAGGSSGPAPTPTYATPSPIGVLVEPMKGSTNTIPAVVNDPDGTPYFYVGDRVKAIRKTGRYQKAFDKALRVGPDIEAGETFDVTFAFQSDDKRVWYISPYFTRILAEDTVRVSDLPLSETPSVVE